MNRTTLYKPLKFAAQFLKSSSMNDRSVLHRYSTYFRNQCELSPSKLKLSSSNISKNQSRGISSSNPASSKSNEHSKDDMLADEDFQNILKDFAKDFHVSSESKKILEDIKKSLNELDAKDDSSTLNDRKESSSGRKEIDLHGASEEKFKEFSDSDAVVFHSYEDFIAGKYEEGELLYHIDQNPNLEVLPEQSKRGITGVFDIHELVEALKRENMLDIAVISIPKEQHYADYLVLANVKSPRHSTSAVEHLMKLYKLKKHKKDPFAIVEGEKVADWKAIDMGNIVLHVFLNETRAFYDIESLWLFDPKYDSGGTLKPDPLYDAIAEQMAFFNALETPSSVPESEAPKETT